MRWWLAALGVLATTHAPTHAQAPASPNTLVTTASGVVYNDKNRNGSRDRGEEGLPGVGVSNQREVVQTDKDGHYSLPVDANTILFVVKPANYATPVDALNIPRFSYIHKPDGSPKQRFPGVAPTGPLPASVDFPLYRRDEPKRFRAVFLGDTQTRNETEVAYLARDIIPELIGSDSVFGVTLGDNVYDDLSVFPALKQTVGAAGIPWHYVLGNHDENYDSPDEEHSTETFQSHFGPPYYSYNYGQVHFIVLDDVIWNGVDEQGKAKGYGGGIGAKQLEFLKNDLSLVPKDHLVVLMMHIPINQFAEHTDIFQILAGRPSFSISGHAHEQRQYFLGEKDGWKGRTPHHHLVAGAACGDWWQGAPDEEGIPHATMADGTPNGYSIITFDGADYSIAFKAARRPATYQMHIWAPDTVAAADAAGTEVLANVFAGSERSKVEMALDGGSFGPMERVAREDPFLVAIQASEDGPTPPNGRRLSQPDKSTHIWRATLPAGLAPGAHVIHVRTRDMFGQVYNDYRIVHVT